MNQAPLDELLKLLTIALCEPLRRQESVARFQAIVWEGLDAALPGNVRDVLGDLAYDLDFFEARREKRAQDEEFYGHRDLEKEILEAIEKLKAAGIEIPG